MYWKGAEAALIVQILAMIDIRHGEQNRHYPTEHEPFLTNVLIVSRFG